MERKPDAYKSCNSSSMNLRRRSDVELGDYIVTERSCITPAKIQIHYLIIIIIVFILFLRISYNSKKIA